MHHRPIVHERLAEFAGKSLQVMFGQKSIYRRPGVQWRNLNGDDIEAVIKILPECFLLRGVFQIKIRGGYDQHIDGYLDGTANAPK